MSPADPVAIARDGSRVAVGLDDGVKILRGDTLALDFKIGNEAELGFGSDDAINSLALSKDGKTLAIGGLGDLLIVYSLADKTKKPLRLECAADSIALSPNGESTRFHCAFLRPAISSAVIDPARGQWRLAIRGSLRLRRVIAGRCLKNAGPRGK